MTKEQESTETNDSHKKAMADLSLLLKDSDLLKIQQSQQIKQRKIPKTSQEYKFWKTQPVPKTDEEISINGPIEPNKQFSEIQQSPYSLPKDFEWSLINVDDKDQINQVYDLLALNYVEDDDCTFRFDYSIEFLRWAMQPPNCRPDWIVGVRVSSNKKLVAFISAVPATMRIHEHQQEVVEINFLCVHKKLRSKRLAPVMIKEITRRVHLHGIFQAVYTAGIYLPTPYTTSRYYHRTINPKKLIEVGFSRLQSNMTMARTIRLLRVPDIPSTPGIRAMVEADVDQVCILLNKYLSKFKVAPTFSADEIRHWILPIENVMFSYVAEDPNSKKITDFVSFYCLPSTIIGHPVHSHLNAAFLYYYANDDMGKDPKRLQTLIKDALIFARNNKFDVFNSLNLMDNESFLEELKFGKGDGDLHYYLYNYRCKSLNPNETGLVLL